MEHRLEMHIDILSDKDMLILRSGSARKQDQLFVQKHLATNPEDTEHALQPDGVTALHVACAMGPIQTARALLAAGANPARRTKEGTTALDLARKKKRHQLVRLLTQQIKNHKETACSPNH